MHRLLVVLVFTLACTKDEAPRPADSIPDAGSAPVSAPASISAPASASPADSDSGSDAGAPRPLQAWMKKNMTPAMNAQDFDALGAGLDAIATFAPKEPGYPNWTSIAKDGKNAAKGADLGAVRAACRGCHEQYKAKYKAELRARPIPP